MLPHSPFRALPPKQDDHSTDNNRQEKRQNNVPCCARPFAHLSFPQHSLSVVGSVSVCWEAGQPQRSRNGKDWHDADTAESGVDVSPAVWGS